MQQREPEPAVVRQGSSTYMPQLDALRAIAVLAVMFHHFVPARAQWPLFAAISFGQLGVKLFFVLSGFLITGILLRARSKLGDQPRAVLSALAGFYARRSLRIFPLYYLVIAVCLVLNVPPVRDELLWLATYTLNLRISYQGWYPEHVAHFWSLAVEEQFYLLWPWVVLFAPSRRLGLIALVCAAFGPAYRALAMLLEFQGEAYFTFTLSSFDALGAGALLAIVSRGDRVSDDLRRLLARRLLPGAALFAGLLSAGNAGAAGLLRDIFFDTAIALVFVSIIGIVSVGVGGFAGRFLESRVMTYLGRISYGLYVYHALLKDWIYQYGVARGVEWEAASFFVAASAITVAVAALSWHLFERPLNELKNRFPYAKGKSDGMAQLSGLPPEPRL